MLKIHLCHCCCCWRKIVVIGIWGWVFLRFAQNRFFLPSCLFCILCFDLAFGFSEHSQYLALQIWQRQSLRHHRFPARLKSRPFSFWTNWRFNHFSSWHPDSHKTRTSCQSTLDFPSMHFSARKHFLAMYASCFWFLYDILNQKIGEVFPAEMSETSWWHSESVRSSLQPGRPPLWSQPNFGWQL